MARAKEDELGDLHGVFAHYLSERLKSGDATSQELNVIRQFLKDNDISCLAERNNDMMDILQDLPQYDNPEIEAVQ